MSLEYAHYCSIGSTLANMKNVESIVGIPPQYLTEGRVPLMGEVKRRVGSGRIRSDGFIRSSLIFDRLSREQYRALLLHAFGGYTINSAYIYLSWVDDLGYYSPFHIWIERPTRYRDFTPSTMNGVVFPLHDGEMVSLTKSADYTITTADRLIYFDTSGGSRTATLPPAASVEPESVYACIKSATANSLIIDGDGSELVDGATTKTLTALHERADLVSDGTAWYSVSDGG